ncbi:hypothetical protein RvY_06237 [Ramazzottius varieornatus]|uniref:Uncharacterized protein n=1 Tax=Ramazzottius varieornatus TaxID=947166 RepID=A0A1D1UXU0_RAMVA|nr:hypothetical protein RvY_06237 [Ramazzottius varieornatus]
MLVQDVKATDKRHIGRADQRVVNISTLDRTMTVPLESEFGGELFTEIIQSVKTDEVYFSNVVKKQLRPVIAGISVYIEEVVHGDKLVVAVRSLD